MAIPLFNPNLYNWSDPTNPLPVQPNSFADHVANPANVQSIAGFLTPPVNIQPTKKPSLFDSTSKFFAPARQNVLNRIPQLQGNQTQQTATIPPIQTAQDVSQWFQPSPQTQQDQQRLRDLQNSGAGVNQIQNRPLNILGRIGDVAASILFPHAAQFIPGTTAHNLQLQGQQQQRVQNDVAADQANAQRVTQGLQAADTISQTNLRNAQAAQVPELTQLKQAQLDQAYSRIGYRPTLDANGNSTGQYEVDPNSPAYQKQQAQNDYFAAREELSKAQADLARAKNDPNSPAFKQAQQRVNTAMANASTAAGRLGMSEKNYMLKAYGTDGQGNALPGALVDDEGNTVGTAFNKNVLPTGQERNKADLAHSADEQLGDIKRIIQKHPTMFGPGYGQTSQFRQWLGSQDPDAQRFIAARTIAGDHLAGVFGGRSEAALDALDKAIGQFKDNPQAALAGVYQLSKANKSFIKAGTVPRAGKARPSNVPAGTPTPPAGTQQFTDNGVVYHIPTSQVAAFKKDHPNAR